MKQQGNIFDFLRFAAATMVIWGHAYDLNAVPGVPVVFAISINSLGLLLFFIISGYLVTQSLERSRNTAEFFWKRALRILPGLTACTFFMVFVLGPLVTAMPQNEYWSSPLVPIFLKNAILNVQYALPGVYQQNHMSAVNGSLWSLPVEALCYVALGVLGTLFLRVGNKLLFICIAALSLITAAFFHDYDGPPIIFYNVSLSQVFLVAQYFFVASAMAILLKRQHFRLEIAVACIVLLLLATKANNATVIALGQPVLLSYVVLAIGQRSIPFLRNWSALGDASYGMYLYAFPIQQALAETIGGSLNLGMTILLSVIVSAACGYLSWHAFEKHALKLKDVWRRKDSGLPTGQQQPIFPSSLIGS